MTQTSALSKTLYFSLALIIFSFVLAPIAWQVSTSLKTNSEISKVPLSYFPRELTLGQYSRLLAVQEGEGYFFDRPFLSYMWNSTLVSLSSTLLCLLIAAPAAYALSRFALRVEPYVLAAMFLLSLFPYILLALGLLELVQLLNIANTYLVLILPYTALNLPLSVITLRSFFKKIPEDLEYAALLDGYTPLQVLYKVFLPLSTPALFTTGILAFIFSWNEFLLALTFISSDSLKTIPVAAAQLSASSLYEIPYGVLAAATVVGTAPLVLLVLFFQNRIVQGLTAGAVKG